jgi:threonine dehydrogenase-like Zn-dependent dehydrogenase
MSGGSIGLYAADIARVYGAGSVRYVDASARRRDLAAELGAEASTLEDFDPAEHEYPIALVTHGGVDALRAAILATAPGGHVENLGFHFADVPLPVSAMHFNCVTFRSALSNARPSYPRSSRSLPAVASAPGARRPLCRPSTKPPTRWRPRGPSPSSCASRSTPSRP